MPRLLPLLALLIALPVLTAEPTPKPPPVAAKLVTLSKSGTLAEVAAEVTKQAGLPFDLSAADGSAKVTAAFDRTPFWVAADKLAADTGHRLALDGNKVKVVKRASGVKPAPSAVDGPFRVAVKRVTAKRDFDAAATEYEVQLDVFWEPRFPVFLIDGEPRVSEVAVSGAKPTAEAPTGRVMPTGYSHTATVRVKGIPRGAKQIDTLSGTFAVVAAEKVLAVEFKDLTGDKPVTQTADGVAVTLRPARKLEKRVEFGVELLYPASHPTFESFQLWAGGNKFRLIGPDNRTAFEPTDYSSDENGRRVRADYNFAGPNGKPFALPDLKGWRVVYETPGPMVEQAVTFKLTGIELP